MKHLKFLNQKGQSVVEMLIAFSLAAIVITAFLNGFLTLKQSSVTDDKRLRAVLLKDETVELVRLVRAESFEKVATLEGDYHPRLMGAEWIFQSGEEKIDELKRKVTFSKVYRNSTGVITDTGILDPSILRAKVMVSWEKPVNSYVETSIFLTRYLDNSSFMQPGNKEFSNYTTLSDLEILSSPQKIQLAPTLTGWCNTPQISQVGSFDVKQNGINRAFSNFSNKFFLSDNEIASADDVSILQYNEISGSSPPQVSLYNTFRKNYQANGIYAKDNYIYLTTNTRNKQAVILQYADNQKVEEVGFLDLGRTLFGENVHVFENFAYVTSGNRLFAFNVTTKNGTKQPISNLTLAGNISAIQAVRVLNNVYLLASIDSLDNQLQIINVTNLSQTSPSMQSLSTLKLQVSNVMGAKDLYVSNDGNRVYVLTAYALNAPEIFIVDISNKSIPRVLNTWDSGANLFSPTALTVAEGDRKLAVSGTGGIDQLILVDIANETALTQCSVFQEPSGTIYDVSFIKEVDGDSYIYMLTGDINGELKILEGNTQGKFKPSGVYESSTFESTSSAVFNRFEATVNQPLLTSVKFKVAVSSADALGKCNNVNYSYVGPSGDPAIDDYFSESLKTGLFQLIGRVPTNNKNSYKNPGKCFRYKAYFNTDPSQTLTPQFENVFVNFSP